MRGEITDFDEAAGTGRIEGGDGIAYAFAVSDLRGGGLPARGRRVEFHRAGDRARDVVVLAPLDRPPAPPQPDIESAAPAGAAVERPSLPPPVIQPHHPGRFGRNADPSLESHGVLGSFLHALTGGYADFRSRARRKEYWGFALFYTIAFVIVIGSAMWFDDAYSDVYSDGQYLPVYTLIAFAILTLATFVPALAVSVRRFHDVGLSGWLLLLFLALSVIGVGSIVIFVIALIPSQRHDNKWGPPPAGVDA